MPDKQKLERDIIRHRFLYYLGNPSISDSEYDKLERELKEIDPNNKLFSEIGFDINSSTFDKINHEHKMASQDKVYLEEELLSWFESSVDEYVQSLKIDGFAITLCYEYNSIIDKYILKYGASRGDGKTGEDITENVKTIKDIPMTLDIPKGFAEDRIEIRGEIYMKKSVFELVAKTALIEDKKEYKTPRNLASGSARNKNAEITKKRNLSFYCYDAIGFNFKEYSEILSFVLKLGIPIVEHSVTSKQEIWKKHKENEKKRSGLDFCIDGTVVRINNIDKFEELGETSHHSRGSIAIKFEMEEYESKLLRVIWETSRTGLINPVAVIEPTEIDGVTVTRATLHNISYIEELGLEINCGVIVVRRGDVIPKIIRKTTSGTSSINIPAVCPCCGERSNINISDSGVKTVCCVNKECPAVKLAEFEHFVEQMGMKGIAGETLDKLIKAGFIKEFSDLFKIDTQMILTIDGFKKKSAENIFNTIQLNRRKSLSVFLSSLGIQGLGKSVSALVSNNFKDIYEITSDYNETYKKLCNISGIAEKTANSIIEGLQDKKNIIDNLLKYVEISTTLSTTGTLSGMLFCLSGSMTNGKDSLKKIIEQYGGTVKSSVVKNLTYLIAGEGSGEKSKKATELGIPIISEETFMNMIGQTIQKEDSYNNISKKEEKIDSILSWLD